MPSNSRKRTSSRRRKLPSNVQQAAEPKARLQGLFQLIEEIYDASDRELFSLLVPEGDDAARHLGLEAGVLARATNALKAITLLCEQAHWEFAVCAVRQLFEIVVNVEYLNAQTDRDIAAFRFAKYGLLQMVLEQHGTLEYDQRTGRQIDRERLLVLKRMLATSFPEFRTVGASGHVHWAKSWTGRDTRRLAELSPHTLRKDQYQLLYSAWSEQAHASPSVFLESIVGTDKPVDEIVSSDDTRIAETMSIAISLFIELRRALPHLPSPDITEQLDWIRRLLDEAQRHGAPSPAPFVGETRSDPQ